MRELNELTYDIITNAFIKALADIDKGTAERDKHFVAATELIIKNFKAHIEGCEKPKKSPVQDKRDDGEISWDLGFYEGVEEDRKALMESLEEEKG